MTKLVEGIPTTRHPLYALWWGMIGRCYYESADSYVHYGQRGIRVCDRWRRSLANFVEDMGPRPEGYTLDRIDNDGDYTPENCRWCSQRDQLEKRRTPKNNTTGERNISIRKSTGEYLLEMRRKGQQLRIAFKTMDEAVELRDFVDQEVWHGL